MAISPRSGLRTGRQAQRYHGLDRETLIRAFRIMQTARRLDDREVLLKRQNRIWFQISGAGHECIQTAAGLLLKPGEDWFFTYYRDRALALAVGITPETMLMASVGAAADTFSGGRQMPSHWSDPALHVFTGSSPTGTQFGQAVGSACSRRYLKPGSDELTLVTTGEGATSEGEFWESLNVACLERLPLLYLVEDNGYAISTPVERQTGGRQHFEACRRLPGSVHHRMRRQRFHGLVGRDEPGHRLGALGTRSRAGSRTRDPALLPLAF